MGIFETQLVPVRFGLSSTQKQIFRSKLLPVQRFQKPQFFLYCVSCKTRFSCLSLWCDIVFCVRHLLMQPYLLNGADISGTKWHITKIVLVLTFLAIFFTCVSLYIQNHRVASYILLVSYSSVIFRTN